MLRFLSYVRHSTYLSVTTLTTLKPPFRAFRGLPGREEGVLSGILGLLAPTVSAPAGRPAVLTYADELVRPGGHWVPGRATILASTQPMKSIFSRAWASYLALYSDAVCLFSRGPSDEVVLPPRAAYNSDAEHRVACAQAVRARKLHVLHVAVRKDEIRRGFWRRVLFAWALCVPISLPFTLIAMLLWGCAFLVNPYDVLSLFDPSTWF